MNIQALAHRSDSRFSYALGGTKARIILQCAHADPDLKKVELLYHSWTSFYKEQIALTLPVKAHDALYDYYQADLDNGNPDYVYIFRLTDAQGKLWFYSESGLTENYDFSTCFLNEFFFAYPNPIDVVDDNPSFQGRLFYQIFPERFACSDFKKPYINQRWDEKKVDNLRYEGGDFQGIIAKLPYLASLGVGALYLNPIHPASSAHMYDVEDYYGINSKLGNADDLHELIRQAHGLDIKIVLDLVFNHSSNKNSLFLDVIKNGKESPYWDFYFIDGDKPRENPLNYLTFCGVKTMPRLNTSNPKVQAYLCGVGRYWLQKFQVDGFRLDVAFDVSHAFWRRFKESCVEVNPEVVLIGEDWLNSESRLSKGEWDSVMNYPFRLALLEEHAGRKGGEWLAERLTSLLYRYDENSDRMMLNLLSSHDVARYLSQIQGDRDFYFQSYALTMFYPGWPCLYYGDEILTEGGNDPDNRRGMDWTSPLFEKDEGILMRKILILRKEEALKKGTWALRFEKGLFRIDRFYGGGKWSLFLNLERKQATLSLGENILTYRLDGPQLAPGGFVVRKEKEKE